MKNRAQEYAYKEVKNCFPTLHGNSFQLINLIIESAYIQGDEFQCLKNIGENSEKYANNTVADKFEKYPTDTKRLLHLLIQHAFIQACEDNGKDVTIEKIEITSQLCQL